MYQNEECTFKVITASTSEDLEKQLNKYNSKFTILDIKYSTSTKKVYSGWKVDGKKINVDSYEYSAILVLKK